MSKARSSSAVAQAWPDQADHDALKLAPPVRRFLVALRRAPLAAWIEASMTVWRIEADMELGRRAYVEARQELRRVIDEMPRTARGVKSRVDFLASVARGIAGPATVGAMVDVALVAALALAARPRLSESEFARLYAPFATLIPLDDSSRA